MLPQPETRPAPTVMPLPKVITRPWRHSHPGRWIQIALCHFILLVYTFIALFPVGLIIFNSFKERRDIFAEPYSIVVPKEKYFFMLGYEILNSWSEGHLKPSFAFYEFENPYEISFSFHRPFVDVKTGEVSWSLGGYREVLARANFPHYFLNSLIVTTGSLVLILWFGTMAAFALSEYNFLGNNLVSLYMAIGIMIPIRLGTVSLLRLMVAINWQWETEVFGKMINIHIHMTNSLYGLILIYTASGLPLAIFILSNFMRQVPLDLKDAARIDGASEYRIYWMILPLVRPAIGTVAVFNMIPIWNDLWFPMLLAPREDLKTVTLGAQVYLGQFVSRWSEVLSSLTLSMVPILILYIIFSRQLIRGLTAGSVK